jgi:hypothetical protein
MCRCGHTALVAPCSAAKALRPAQCLILKGAVISQIFFQSSRIFLLKNYIIKKYLLFHTEETMTKKLALILLPLFSVAVASWQPAMAVERNENVNSGTLPENGIANNPAARPVNENVNIAALQNELTKKNIIESQATAANLQLKQAAVNFVAGVRKSEEGIEAFKLATGIDVSKGFTWNNTTAKAVANIFYDIKGNKTVSFTNPTAGVDQLIKWANEETLK